MDEATVKRMQDGYTSRHRSFLAVQHPSMYKAMEDEGTLEEHLKAVGATAVGYYQTLKRQMTENAAKIETVPERQNYIDRIPFVADEIVLAEVVHVKP